MKSFILCCILLFSPLAYSNEIKINFVQNLSNEQKTLLNDFLMNIAQSPSGYVLYGNRPMNIESYDLSLNRILSKVKPQNVTMIKGRELWEDISPSQNNKEYIITSFEKESKCYIVCINRKAFIQKVNENIALFKYVLGPTVTAESLLHELISARDQFYNVLNNDKALLGILLGQGTQNAILDARYRNLAELYGNDQNEEFPFVSKKLKFWSSLPKRYAMQPSMGFHSLVEEEMSLGKMVVSSEKLKPYDSCRIPHFECQPNSQETKELLTNYEENRKKILKAVASKNFLPEILQKLFTNVAQTVEIPRVPLQKGLCLPVNREETIAKLVEIVQKTMGTDSKKFFDSFLQGVIARERGQLPAPHDWRQYKDVNLVRHELECCKNVERANDYFQRLDAREDLAPIVPNALYYKTLKEGNENVLTKARNVSFQYSMQILGDKQSKEWGIVKNENIGSLIPGVALALSGMTEGEERVVYIHPQYAYGENTYYQPNISIVAQIRLLGFEPTDRDVAILPPHHIEKRDYKELYTKYEVLQAEQFFDEGLAFWDSMKKSGDFIDFQIFQRQYNANTEAVNKSFQNGSQEEQFISDLEYYLLSLQHKQV